ncbi:hypothetical protein MRX96_024324 [Rhipicephalus microplus]
MDVRSLGRVKVCPEAEHARRMGHRRIGVAEPCDSRPDVLNQAEKGAGVAEGVVYTVSGGRRRIGRLYRLAEWALSPWCAYAAAAARMMCIALLSAAAVGG